MEEERDLVVFSDDEGNEFELEIVDYFDYEEQEYAILIDPESCGCECEDEQCECEHDIEFYVMKIVANDEFEEFLPVDEDKEDAIAKFAEARLNAFDEEAQDEE
jgi:hypothetical protein